ncbi:gap junction delta-3 protein-like [Oreochromis niloticus]|uniref:gap junction delta-3 protein-like n=1 Tax=Oreochromis niloticus TaxID=8128 RepID=UPI00022AF319|nr:gap junction delta-3 protein-like [Oreochromis niloticus]XP_019218345.1 gap junction delta-3 protein-like [Oreochromis niloticus]XP_019218346.1 gap junction delta-3 protein-like [Oreochromis niloticus]
MGEWGFIGGFFDTLQIHSPMLGRFWLFLMLVFRIVILGTVASDMFEDEQAEFICNTLQPGCKQVCYDEAFPISQYRFWVFHIVLIATPSLLFLVYATHQHNKSANPPPSSKRWSSENREEKALRRLYIITVIFRIVAELGFLITQWYLYGFEVKAYFECSRSPCPLTVKCYTSRPKEKTIFLFFYFIVGVISAFSSIVELLYISRKWFCSEQEDKIYYCDCENLHNLKQEETQEKSGGKTMSESTASSVKVKKGSVRSSSGRKVYCIDHKCKSPRGKYVRRKMLKV